MMETFYYSLDVNKSNRTTRLFQLVFGLSCAGLAITWIILNPDSLKLNSAVLPILFLVVFSLYMINSGLGKGEKFIEIRTDLLRIKKNSLFPARVFNAAEIAKIEIYPLSLSVVSKNMKKFLLRFGTTYTDVIDPIKEGIEEFCSLNSIPVEFMTEEL